MIDFTKKIKEIYSNSHAIRSDGSMIAMRARKGQSPTIEAAINSIAKEHGQSITIDVQPKGVIINIR